jgi:hypothetical protein
LEYILYCDESSQEGLKYSDFFGGCLVSSKDMPSIVETLKTKKLELNLYGEVKWSKVTENYLNKYIELTTLFFSYIKSGKIKVRIMFRNNKDLPTDSTNHLPEDKYFKLYYQFIKHAFGLMHVKVESEPIYLRVYIDQLPDKKEKCSRFKQFLVDLPRTSDFSGSSIAIRKSDVAEVKSHEHVLLQCLDIVLGAMHFRLNKLNKAIPEGQSRRGKRTVAKEKLYKHILNEINDIFPNFNIGESTGNRGSQYPDFYWSHHYRHWRFKPK